jgi:hypothetical protein
MLPLQRPLSRQTRVWQAAGVVYDVLATHLWQVSLRCVCAI